MRSNGRSKISDEEQKQGRGVEPRPFVLPTHRKLYGRRKGPKLSAYQQGLVDTLLPHLAIRRTLLLKQKRPPIFSKDCHR